MDALLRSFRLLLALAALVLLALPARADRYKVEYSSTGGVSFETLFGPDFDPYPTGEQDGGTGNGADHWTDVESMGEIVATCTWVGPDGTPSSATTLPPSVAVVKEISSVRAEWQCWYPPDTVDGTAEASTGLPNQVLSFQFAPPSAGVAYAAVRYTLKGGASFTVSCSPHAHAHGPATSAAEAFYDVEVTPVTIESNFAAHTGQTLNFLVGQATDFFVSAGSYSQDQQHWTPGAHCFREVVYSGYHAAPAIDGGFAYDSRTTYTDVVKDNVSLGFWYYDDEEPSTQVQCSLRLWDGNVLVGNVSVSRPLSVRKPNVSVIAQAGPSTILDSDNTVTSDHEEARAYSTLNNVRGMVIHGTASIDPIFLGNGVR